MKALHLIFGSRNEFLLIILLSFSSYSIAQTKTYSKINIDTLQVKDLRMQDGKIEDIFIKNTDVASANEEFNNLVKECLIISDHQILNLLSREENWQGSIFKSTIPSNIKVGQYSIDQSNRYLYVYDGIKLIRIPILTDYIDNIEAH